jgi:hypothetical protein
MSYEPITEHEVEFFEQLVRIFQVTADIYNQQLGTAAAR